MSQTKKKSKKPGPKSDHLKLEDDWHSAMEKAIRKEKPEEGWPEPEKKEKKDSD